jgi:hypothetical protein
VAVPLIASKIKTSGLSSFRATTALSPVMAGRFIVWEAAALMTWTDPNSAAMVVGLV